MTIWLGLVAAVVVALIGIRRKPLPCRVVAAAIEHATVVASLDQRRALRAARIAVRRVLPVIAVAVGFGVPAGGAAMVALLIRPRLQRLRGARRAARQATAAYPDFVDLLVLSIKAGCSAAQALDALADVVPSSIRPAVTRVIHRTATGQRFADAVGALCDDPPGGLGTIARPLTDALALADRYGTPLPPILERLSEQARTQRRRNAEAAARQLPVHLSFPLVGCTLPSFVLLTIVPLLAGTFSSLPGLSG